MKKTFLILLLFIVTGCTTVTPYTHKAGIPFNKTNFQKAPDVGIAIYNKRIIGLKNVIINETDRFAELSLRFHDLSEVMTLTSDRLRIENPTELKNKYPDIQYVLSTFEYEPEMNQFTTSRTEDYGFPDKSGRRNVREYSDYVTMMTVRCEIMLFDLKEGQLIAKAEKAFSTRRTNSYEDHHSWLPFTLDFFLEKRDYPLAAPVGPGEAIDYFYYFLKHIDFKGFYDGQYVRDRRFK